MTRESRRGSLAGQLQPRLVLTVAVMAALVVITTLLGLRTILYSQLDSDLDAAQSRQSRSTDHDDAPPGLDTPGMQVGTAIAVRLPDGTALGGFVGDGSTNASMTVDEWSALTGVAADGQKHNVQIPGLGTYRAEARASSLGGVVVVGLPLEEVRHTMLWLAGFAGAIGVFAVAATAFVTRAVLTRATKPLVALTDTADEVSRLELERGAVAVPRFESAPLPQSNEVTRLADAFNQMLGRVEGALQARELSEAKLRRFVADASHELRNPLAAIRGYAELGQRSPEGTDHALDRIGSESERMTKLVNDLLLLARLDADARVDPRPVDAVEVVLNAVSDAQASSRDHRWQLELPDEPVEVLADSDQLHQVMVNLLSNARTHTPPGTTVTTSVQVRRASAQPGGGLAVISVTDDGPGIPEDMGHRVFERFTRADDSRAHSVAQSTGLGLAIVRALVESFGGTTSVESRPGATSFTVALPLAHGPQRERQ